MEEIVVDIIKEVGAEDYNNIKKGLIEFLPQYSVSQYFEMKGGRVLGGAEFIVVACTHSGDVVALLSASIAELRVGSCLYLETALVGERYQKKGMLKKLLKKLFEGVKKEFSGTISCVALKTLHPSSFVSMRVFSRIEGIEFYPKINGDPQVIAQCEVHEIAKVVGIKSAVNYEWGIVEGGGGGVKFYSDRPYSKDMEVNNYFSHRVAMTDRVLCVLSLRTEKAMINLLRYLGCKSSHDLGRAINYE